MNLGVVNVELVIETKEAHVSRVSETRLSQDELGGNLTGSVGWKERGKQEGKKLLGRDRSGQPSGYL